MSIIDDEKHHNLMALRYKKVLYSILHLEKKITTGTQSSVFVCLILRFIEGGKSEIYLLLVMSASRLLDKNYNSMICDIVRIISKSLLSESS